MSPNLIFAITSIVVVGVSAFKAHQSALEQDTHLMAFWLCILVLAALDKSHV